MEDSPLIDHLSAKVSISPKHYDHVLDRAESLQDTTDDQGIWTYDAKGGTKTIDKKDVPRHHHLWAHRYISHGGVTLWLNDNSFEVTLEPLSLPALLIGHNGRLLFPSGITHALVHVDRLFAALEIGIPLVAWKAIRVDYTLDLPVEEALVPIYMRALARQCLVRRGKPPIKAAYDAETVYWRYGRKLRQITVYDKVAELARRRIEHPGPEGILRLEVRQLSRGCYELAKKLAKKRPAARPSDQTPLFLTVGAAADPRLAYAVLSEYVEALELGRERGESQVLARLLKNHRLGNALQLYGLFCATAEGWQREDIARLGASSKGARRHLCDLYADLREDDIRPADEKLPGLWMPSYEEFLQGGVRLAALPERSEQRQLLVSGPVLSSVA